MLVPPGVFSDEGTPLEAAGMVPPTGISRDRITHIGNVFSSLPDDFVEHRGVWVCVVLCAYVLYMCSFLECELSSSQRSECV